jgi:spore germination protein YaaH
MFGNLLNIQASNRYVLGFDAALGVPWMSYATKTQSYKIWFENKQSFQQKLNLIQQNNLRGFSAWMLGGEDPAIWTTL